MGKENLTFRNIETEKKMYRYMTPLFKKDIDIDLLVRKAISTLLVTCIMIIKLSHNAYVTLM